jgi:phosphoribosyl 1,2-cyclic phosphate phosphodiesterase
VKITFLGTGTSSGVPLIGCQCEVCTSDDSRDKRLRVSIHIETNGKSFVIDTGPDFRQQMLRANINHLDAVLFTHEHKDHTAGLDDVRAYNFLQHTEVPAYARLQVLEQLKAEFAYIFAEHKYAGVPLVKLNEIKNKAFEVEGVSFLPIEVMHYRLPVFGYRINDFAYITDVNFISETELLKLENLDVLVLGALQISSHPSHYTLAEAIEVAQRIGAKQTYFTHISHKMGKHEAVSQALPPAIYLAYDGLELTSD